jgi:hypothetical protein
MTWGGIKKGDTVMVVDMFGEKRERVHEGCEVLSVGRRWITVQVGRSRVQFDAESGHGEYAASVHTEETLKRAHEGRELLRKIRPVLWETVPVEKLRLIVAVLEGDLSTIGDLTILNDPYAEE